MDARNSVLIFSSLQTQRNIMRLYEVKHKESGKSVVIEQEVFNRDKILEQASTEMGTSLDIKQYGEYGIHPHIAI